MATMQVSIDNGGQDSRFQPANVAYWELAPGLAKATRNPAKPGLGLATFIGAADTHNGSTRAATTRAMRKPLR